MKENENASSVRMQVVLSKMLFQISRAMQAAAEELSEHSSTVCSANEVSVITVKENLEKFLKLKWRLLRNREYWKHLEILSVILFWLWKQPEEQGFRALQLRNEFDLRSIAPLLQYLLDISLITYKYDEFGPIDLWREGPVRWYLISWQGKDLVEGRL